MSMTQKQAELPPFMPFDGTICHTLFCDFTHRVKGL